MHCRTYQNCCAPVRPPRGGAEKSAAGGWDTCGCNWPYCAGCPYCCCPYCAGCPYCCCPDCCCPNCAGCPYCCCPYCCCPEGGWSCRAPPYACGDTPPGCCPG